MKYEAYRRALIHHGLSAYCGLLVPHAEAVESYVAARERSWFDFTGGEIRPILERVDRAPTTGWKGITSLADYAAKARKISGRHGFSFDPMVLDGIKVVSLGVLADELEAHDMGHLVEVLRRVQKYASGELHPVGAGKT